MQIGFIHNALLIAARQHLWKFFPYKLHVAIYIQHTKNPRRGVGFARASPVLNRQAGDMAIRLGLAALNSSAETLVEALYAATSGRLLLLTCVERVAVGAHIQREVLTRGRTYLESSAARTVGGDRVVIRVNTLSHFEPH
jgi:hypothetical protein